MSRVGRREDLLAAARRLFASKGYHGTSIRDIAQASGMLSGSLYAHIDAKADLLFAITDAAAAEFLAAVTPIAEGAGTAAERLRRAVAAHILVVARAADAATVFLHEWRALAPPQRAEIQAKRELYEGLFQQIIAEGMASGEFRGVEPKFARLLVLSAANWVYQWYRADGPLDAEQIADRLTDLLLHGLVVRSGEERP